MNKPNPIEKLDTAIALIEDGLASKEEVMSALAFKQQLGEITRALNYRFEQAAIAWIEKNGEIEEGEKRWYVGTVTNRKCKDVRKALDAILTSCGGDLDTFVRALSSSCFKPATAMEILGETATDHFTSETVQDLKTGKPRKALKGVPIALGKGQTEDESED